MSAIELSEEQAMLLDQAAGFVREAAPMARVRTAIMKPEGDPRMWASIVELGWAGIAIPVELGGVGLGLAEVAPVAEMMGRNLMPSPFIAVTLAAQALLTSGSEAQKAEWLPKIAAGTVATLGLTEEDGDWSLESVSTTWTASGGKLRLKGTKCFVLDADTAELFIVSAKLRGEAHLVAVRKDQLLAGAVSRETVVDETRRSFRLVLDDVVVDAGQMLPGRDFKAIERAALLLAVAEIAGGIAGVLNVTVEYLKTRKQFGKLIGSYQALKHPMVDVLIGLERSRSYLYSATTLIARGELVEADIALRMAKASGSEAFAFAGDRAVQFHGGFGFTWDCDAQLYLRRALWLQYQWGDERYHRQILAPLLLDGVEA